MKEMKINLIKAGITVLVFLSIFVMLTIGNTAESHAALKINDGEYAVEVTMAGGSGKVTVDSPTLLKVQNGEMTARINWSSSNYDYMIVDGVKYDNLAEEGMHSYFEVPVAALDRDLTFIADTLAMGTPHEIEYTFNFPSRSVGSKSMLPQEAAKRVLVMAAVIIVAGGILNHFVQKKRKVDYKGKKRRSVI